MVASAVIKTHLFPQPVSPLTEQGVRVDAVHDAFLRLTPLLTDSSRRLHGWTDQRVEVVIQQLRDDAADAKAAARGDPAAATPAQHDLGPEPAELPWPVEILHTRLTELALLLRRHPGLRAASTR